MLAEGCLFIEKAELLAGAVGIVIGELSVATVLVVRPTDDAPCVIVSTNDIGVISGPLRLRRYLVTSVTGRDAVGLAVVKSNPRLFASFTIAS